MAERRRWAAIVVAIPLVMAACGSDDSSTDDPALSGFVREPAPEVDEATLPSLTEPGTEVEFSAQPGEIQVVYFGYTNCPDVCPTTLADLTVALRKIEPARAEQVETVMVTVDPERDLDVLPGYVSSFIPDAVAAGTEDEAALLAVAEPFGVSWDIRTLDDGTIEVDHSPFLYAVDDQGELVLTWQFGASSDDMAADLDVLFDRYAA